MNWQQRNGDHHIFTLPFVTEVAKFKDKDSASYLDLCWGLLCTECLQYSQIASPLNTKTLTLNQNTAVQREPNTPVYFSRCFKEMSEFPECLIPVAVECKRNTCFLTPVRNVLKL